MLFRACIFHQSVHPRKMFTFTFKNGNLSKWNRTERAFRWYPTNFRKMLSQTRADYIYMVVGFFFCWLQIPPFLIPFSIRSFAPSEFVPGLLVLMISLLLSSPKSIYSRKYLLLLRSHQIRLAESALKLFL